MQLERTLLAWLRTALLVAVNGAPLLKAGLDAGPWVLVAGGIVLVAAVVMWTQPTIAYRASPAASVAGGRNLLILLAAATAIATAVISGLVVAFG